MEADELPSRRPDPYRWQDHAACKGADTALFFPERGGSIREAKALCGGCPVRLECLDAGMDEHYGIWGGQSERGRRRIRRAGLRRTLPERQCKLCGETFRPTVPQQIYCCPEHTSTAAHRAHAARKREAEKHGPRPERVELRPELVQQYREWVAS